MKLTAQITIVFAALIIIPLAIFITIFYLRTYKTFENQYLTTTDKEASHVLNRLKDIAHYLRVDVDVLIELSSVQGLINAETPEDSDRYRLLVQNDFISIAQNHDWYYQIRYIDEEGQEVVRVDKYGDTPYIVSESELQNKKDRNYFQATMATNPDSFYISELDLNIENGVLENRGSDTEPEYVPVIRLARVVTDRNGANKGIIITNIYANEFLNILRDSSTDDSQYYLANNEGYFLYHPDPKKTFSFVLGNENYSINDEFPSLKEDPKNEIVARIGESHIYRKRINIFSEQSDPVTTGQIENVWSFIKKTDTNNIKMVANDVMGRLLIYGFIIISIAILVGYFFIRLVLRPLRMLREGTAIIASGDLDHRIPVESNDEIGALADDFNSMVRDLKKSRESVDSKIRDRTERLSKLNKILIGRELKMAELKKRISEIGGKHEK